jgi:hypothetical protein
VRVSFFLFARQLLDEFLLLFECRWALENITASDVPESPWEHFRAGQRGIACRVRGCQRACPKHFSDAAHGLIHEVGVAHTMLCHLPEFLL